MDKKSKIAVGIIAVVVVVLAAVAVYFAAGLNTQQMQANDSPAVTQPANNEQAKTEEKEASKTVTYKGVEGKTALELLKSNNIVETKVYSGVGEMVVSIDGVKPADSSEFWAFYVEGKQAQVGADQYVTKDGEKIEWKLEKIQ